MTQSGPGKSRCSWPSSNLTRYGGSPSGPRTSMISPCRSGAPTVLPWMRTLSPICACIVRTSYCFRLGLNMACGQSKLDEATRGPLGAHDRELAVDRRLVDALLEPTARHRRDRESGDRREEQSATEHREAADIADLERKAVG